MKYRETSNGKNPLLSPPKLPNEIPNWETTQCVRSIFSDLSVTPYKILYTMQVGVKNETKKP